MYYEYYYQPLFGRHLRKWKLQADLTQLRENLGSERGSTITHGIDDGAVVSLAERSDPFIWFMAGVVSTLHCLLVPEEIVNDILSTTFTVLHEDGVSLEEAQNPQVKPLDDKMRDVLIELYSGSNQRRCLLNRFGPSTSSGKRLLEDIKSWRHIGFLSGLVAIIHSRLESEPTVEVKIVDTYCRTSPEVVKVELTQFLLGLIRPGGDVLLVETECSDIAISHPQSILDGKAPSLATFGSIHNELADVPGSRALSFLNGSEDVDSHLALCHSLSLPQYYRTPQLPDFVTADGIEWVDPKAFWADFVTYY
ncbi:hypothetical protein MMC34_008742 [Xylographa carneopallida]|nr:hypothetical protein [Xylographa carneopallida]